MAASKEGKLLMSNTKGLNKKEKILTITGELVKFIADPVLEVANSDALVLENSLKESKEASSIFVNSKTNGKIRKAIPIKEAKNINRWKSDNLFPEKYANPKPNNINNVMWGRTK